jgi:hypothetical protein
MLEIESRDNAYALLATLFDEIRAGQSFAQHRAGFRRVDETQERNRLFLGAKEVKL